MKCWHCGVEPVNVYEVTSVSATDPEYLYGWPSDTDHRHAEVPPTPAELAASGDAALARVIEAWRP